jgi:antirestriction protein ArdC
MSVKSNRRRKKMNVYEIVTNKIVECLNNGVVPWQKNWNTIPYSNYCTKKEYRGINQLLLFSQSVINNKNYTSPYWLTWKQVKKLKGSVNKNEKASIIIFYDSKIIDNETININNEKETAQKKISFLKYYNVFNYEQTSGIKEIDNNKNENEYIKPCEELFDSATDKPVIKTGVNPSYNPLHDYIIMPDIKSFKSSDCYYSTLFHEAIHWTGHKSRLDRFKDISLRFGSEVYSKEELTAELGSSFLCHITGIEKELINNHASYIKGWLEVLKNDKKLIIQASTQAGKAVDFLLSLSMNNALIKTA